MKDFPNIVTQRLRAAAKPDVHPDADLLTAFVEKSLGQHESQDILKHLADCGDCRNVVALAFPEEVIDRSVPLAGRSAWTSWPLLHWGAAAACVVMVAVVGLHYRSNRASTPATILSSDTSAVRSDSPKAQIAENRAATLSQPVTQTPIDMRKKADADAASNQIAPAESANEGALEKKQLAPRDQLQSRSTSALAAQKTTPGEKEALKTMASAPPVNANAGTDALRFVPGRAKDESAPAAKAPMAMAGGLPNRQTAASSAMIARAATVPSNVTPRWILTSDGMLQRSLDSGRTWETILVASPGTFRALTANGFEIWVGGAKGSLYHSIDAGQHWMKVEPISADESLSADIIGIEFTDLLHGTLTTADQQTWITADAGHTWQKQ